MPARAVTRSQIDAGSGTGEVVTLETNVTIG